MGEVELSSALAPLSRCRIPSPLAGMPSIARRRIAATLSARRRAENVASSSLDGSEQWRAAHRHEHVEHEHDMHGSVAGRSRADLRWQAHPSQAKTAPARAPSNFVPCGCKQAPPQTKVRTPKLAIDGSVCDRAWACALPRLCVQCTQPSLSPSCAMPRRCAGLRCAFARFLGKANASQSQCLSSGATRRTAYDLVLACG